MFRASRPPDHSGAQHAAPTGLMRDGGDSFFYTHAAPPELENMTGLTIETHIYKSEFIHLSC